MKITIAFVISVLVYTVCSFAYIQSTYVPKDMFTMICERLERIENKIDHLRGVK